MNPHLAKARDAVERFADFDPATLYEAAGRTGMVDPAIRPAWHGAKVCGLAVTVECPPGDNPSRACRSARQEELGARAFTGQGAAAVAS